MKKWSPFTCPRCGRAKKIGTVVCGGCRKVDSAIEAGDLEKAIRFAGAIDTTQVVEIIPGNSPIVIRHKV